ncbi:MAG: hypothetical protein KJ800_00355 [Proteobacteria bacterium]|nr:hypothetical protein [Pseudomonadota bacterium]
MADAKIAQQLEAFDNGPKLQDEMPARKKARKKSNGYEPPNLGKTKPLTVPDFSDPDRPPVCLESLMSQVGQRTDQVDRWRNSDQKQRWVASALLDIEPRLRRIKGYRHLPTLRAALRGEIRGQSPATEDQVA